MERVWSTMHRGFSVRSILTFVLTVFITALLWVTFGSHTPTHAADAPTATWVGETIVYDGHTYNANNAATNGNSLGIPVDSAYYTYAPSSTSSTGATAKVVKAFVIYFTPGTDPPTATTATFTTYDYLPSKGYSNPSGKKSITVTPSGKQDAVSSCSVEGIGWIICPVTVFLAKGMDFIFQQISSFMAVQPLTINTSTSSLYIAWNIMRSVANVAFIIVFLIIIYSQLTNMGVSNYGLKKLLPRLIVAAVLVNVSYIICSIAIDISNILGYSLQQLFTNIRANTFSITNDTWSAGTSAWTTVTTVVLSGVGLGILIADPGVLYLLIPVLLGVIMTALVVLLILAARQAIIVILIILAPLAFVAYLLPNTEQWFKKWRELFMTMLIFFPAFSLVFGGSQLASGIILQNASSMPMIVIGLAVQVAPLIITPLLLKLSGSLLGKIAGLVNNPKKGVMDRTKNWAQLRADRGKAAVLANRNTKNPFRRVAQTMAYRDRRVKKDTEGLQAQSEDWMTKRDVTSRSGQKIQVATAMAKANTEELNKDFDQAMQELRAGNETGLARLRMKEDTSLMESVQSRMSGDSVETIRTRRYQTRDANGDLLVEQTTRYGKMAVKYANTMQELDANSRAIQAATAVAQNAQVTNYADMIEHNTRNLKVQAGGIAGKAGQAGALAAAFKAQSAAHGEAVGNAASIMGHYNYSDNDIVELAQGKLTAVTAKNFSEVSDALHEAAITKIASGANANAILKLMTNIDIQPGEGGTAQDFRQAFADALLANSAKPKFAGAGIIAELKQGIKENGQPIPTSGKARIDNFVVQTINANKFGSADVLVSQDKDYIEALKQTLLNNESGQSIDDNAKSGILNAIETIRKNSNYSGRVGESKDAIDAIEKKLTSEGIKAKPVPTAEPEDNV